MYNLGMAIGSHTIPRFYLEQFAVPRKNKSGRVCVYEKGKPPQPRSTKSQGRENGYFQIDQDDGTKDEFTETALGQFEFECIEALVSAKYSMCDLALVHVKLASYAGMLFQRSTVRRKFSARNWSKLEGPYTSLASNQEYVRDLAEHYTELTGQICTSEEIADMIRKQSAMFTDAKHTRSTFVKDLWMHIDICKQELLKKSWQVWHAPENTEFVTSDNPVVTFRRFFTESGEFWNPGYGFGTKNVLIAFPLAPPACLVMTDTPFRGSRARVNADIVQRVNEMLIRSCDRFVYSLTPSVKIAETVDHFGGTSIPGLNAFIGRVVDQTLVEEHLRKAMGIPRRQREA
jgi:Protein of unknown function (DUF4238)